ncbi:hypothetical protein H9X85_10690 [Anaerotignum lactatifermentans]|uniref:MacB-like periplasmic core domain-containing protein n=1 Tax=Anaerotignum lactatifermentans TaxID=160404 RepID=A0ABS2GD98_9FIRM|nr:hypothetical protein [Anaerotignum lactatifermentans]MBM6830031.1 hypothetical protein [Anaerotignum lactatifermentans]MBM6878623.1 hypothetical protein [Anaerotignum lactatifermentans]MBM6951664.1 hypothetical protein [Anaerotignum lactatifermentans]
MKASGIFSAFPNEKVKIVKRDSSIIENIDAVIDSKKIFIENTEIDIEEGDIVERDLPSGSVEQFLVIDRGFHKGSYGIPDHYQIKYRRQSKIIDNDDNKIINQYNISNAEKININSTDNSITYKITDNDLAVMDTICSLAKGLDNEKDIIFAVNEMKKHAGTKSYIEKYNAFIQSIANHMTIFAPFIPLLSSLLIK